MEATNSRSLLSVEARKGEEEKIAALKAKKDALERKIRVEKRTIDAASITKIQTSIGYWKGMLSHHQKGLTSIATLEEQLKKAKENYSNTERYFQERLASTEENLKAAMEGESKKVKKMLAEVDEIEREIAIAELKTSGDEEKFNSFVEKALQKAQKALGSHLPSHPPPGGMMKKEDEIPQPLSQEPSEEEKEAEEHKKKMAARAAAIEEDRQRTLAVMASELTPKTFQGFNIVTNSVKAAVKKQPKKAQSAEEVGQSALPPTLS